MRRPVCGVVIRPSIYCFLSRQQQQNIEECFSFDIFAASIGRSPAGFQLLALRWPSWWPTMAIGVRHVQEEFRQCNLPHSRCCVVTFASMTQLVLALILFMCTSYLTLMPGKVEAPIAEHRDHAVLFGKVEGEDRGPNPMNPPRKRNDPLFWLRDDDRKNPEVIAHLKKEKAYYESRMEDVQDLVKSIYDEHISHIEETSMTAPYYHGPYWYYQREIQGKSYKIYCRCPKDKTPGVAATEEVLMDVNKIADGKAFCDIHGVYPSPSHQLIAYTSDFVGNEVYAIELLDNKNGVKDVVSGTNGGIVWSNDDTAFFYTTKDETLRDNKIWRHVIGQPQSQDVCIYQEDDPLFSVGVTKSGDGNTLLLLSISSETSEYHLLDLRKGNSNTQLELVRAREKGVRYFVELHGTDTLIICTNQDKSPNNKIVVVERSKPDVVVDVLMKHDKLVFVEEHCVLKSFIVVAGRAGGLTRIWVIVPGKSGSFATGAVVRELQMDEPVYSAEPVMSHMKEYEASTFRMVYSSLATPDTYFDVDALTFHRTAVKVREVGGGYDPKNYVVERMMAVAPDTTKIPMSIVYRKDLDLSSPKPCMLYAYGSYGISMDPSFSIKHIPYADRGMVYVIAHIRGGSEMGREWYEVGAKYRTKRNTFSDFIACAEHLIEKGITTPSQLACEGRSAGGLLIGAVLNMRPDLFKAAIAGVPFVDVMTTMCDPSIPLTTGEWEEWGNPNEYKYFDYMLSYSPIDNVRAQEYPNIMVQAGLFDPRVAYWEPTKWVSKLREIKTDSNEILLNMDLESGHFSAKDRYRYWRESAIQQAFVCKHLKAMTKMAIKK
eukprot:gene11984-8256_t